MNPVWDCIVVGAGIQGSFAAYSLIKSGARTLLIEQFPLPHSRGSSHGPTRINRLAYADLEHLTKMMKEAYRLWSDLEEEADVKLFNKASMLTVGKEENPSLRDSMRCMKKYDMPYKVVSDKEKKVMFPMVNFPQEFTYMIDISAGILHADQSLLVLQYLIKIKGGKIFDGEKVSNIVPGDTITVITSKGRYLCRNLVLTVGAWAKPLLSKLHINVPLKVIKIPVLYWKEKTKGQYSISKFPTFFQENAIGPYSVFGSGSYEYEGLVKLCLHDGPETNPDTRDVADQSIVINLMKDYVSKHFPGLNDTPAIAESCMYTMTPDKLFIVDRLPKWRNIVIGVGFSGHGFKLGPVIGKLISEMVLEKPLSTDLHPFRLGRFKQTSKL